jgi:hypothetical protein
MNELVKIIKKKYKNFDITPQWLGKVIRDNNITRHNYPPRFHQYKFNEIYKNPFTRHNRLEHNLPKDIKRYIVDNFL